MLAKPDSRKEGLQQSEKWQAAEKLIAELSV